MSAAPPAHLHCFSSLRQLRVYLYMHNPATPHPARITGRIQHTCLTVATPKLAEAALKRAEALCVKVNTGCLTFVQAGLALHTLAPATTGSPFSAAYGPFYILGPVAAKLEVPHTHSILPTDALRCSVFAADNFGSRATTRPFFTKPTLLYESRKIRVYQNAGYRLSQYDEDVLATLTAAAVQAGSLDFELNVPTTLERFGLPDGGGSRTALAGSLERLARAELTLQHTRGTHVFSVTARFINYTSAVTPNYSVTAGRHSMRLNADFFKLLDLSGGTFLLAAARAELRNNPLAGWLFSYILATNGKRLQFELLPDNIKTLSGLAAQRQDHFNAKLAKAVPLTLSALKRATGDLWSCSAVTRRNPLVFVRTQPPPPDPSDKALPRAKPESFHRRQARINAMQAELDKERGTTAILAERI